MRSTTLKTAVVAPTPSAIAKTAANVKDQLRGTPRKAWRRSWRIVSRLEVKFILPASHRNDRHRYIHSVPRQRPTPDYAEIAMCVLIGSDGPDVYSSSWRLYTLGHDLRAYCMFAAPSIARCRSRAL